MAALTHPYHKVRVERLFGCGITTRRTVALLYPAAGLLDYRLGGAVGQGSRQAMRFFFVT